MKFQDAIPENLPALIERSVSAYPRRTALRSSDAELSYEQLNVAANRVAHALIERSRASDDRIAILMQHDLPQIVVLLGIVKSGRIVVALNPSHPLARLRDLADDSDAALVIVDPANERLGAELARPGRTIVRYSELCGHSSTADPGIKVRGEQAAALGYTSGSTGRPKAVVQTHRQFYRNTEIHTEAMHYSASDCLPLFGSISGGQGMTMVFTALRNGAALCPFPVTTRGVTGLSEWMVDLGITVYASSASIFRSFLKTIPPRHKFDGIRAVRLSSEPATAEDFRTFQRHFPADCIFVHTLSTSETCNIAWSRRSIHDVVPEGRLPVGLPSRGQEVMLLGPSGGPVTPGEVGEIAVRSKYVAAGYWHNEALTAERFSPHLDDAGTRLVRTGDLGRINPAGQLEFIGRSDDRVKVRGNRIELSEVESALRSVAGVKGAVVETIASAGREPVLVGFVTKEPGQPWSPDVLRRAMRDRLPGHMVPSKFVRMDAFPITPTGKIDREALRTADLACRDWDNFEAPRTDMERFIAELWRDAFDLDQVDRHDDFFDLGGDSLIAAVMAARIHGRFGLEVEMAAFFDVPMLAEFAQKIEHLARDHQPEPVASPGARSTEFPMSYGQESFWGLQQSHGPSLTISRCSQIRGNLDVAALSLCIKELIARHEMLRTSFVNGTDGPVQVIHPPGEAPILIRDVSGAPDLESKAQDILRDEQSACFDLSTPPLVRFVLIKLRSDEHWLVYTAHAMVLDGLSWEIFFKEFAHFYSVHIRASAAIPSMNPAPQYGDYASWQRDQFRPDGQRYQDELAWWMHEILTASYPNHAAYRRALMRCMKAVGPGKAPLKQAIGFLLRTAYNVPRPPRSELPFKRKTAVDGVNIGEGILSWGLSPDVTYRLDSLRRQERASHYVIRLAAYIAALSFETGDPDVSVYLSLSNRARAATRDVIGCFLTGAILQVRCDRTATFRELLSIVRDRVRAMQQRADIPYDRIHREMRAWRIRMPQGRAVLSTAWTHAKIRCGDVEITCLPDRHITAPPLQFDTKIDMHNEAENCSVWFDARRYDPAAVAEFIERFKRLLACVSRAPDISIGDAVGQASAQH